MKARSMLFLCGMAVYVAAVVSEASAALSEPVVVDASSYNRHWATVFTNAVPLNWNWVSNATHARLDIVGMNRTFTTNFATVVSNCLWQAFDADVPSAEDAHTLTLTFYGGDEAVAGALTSRLVVVKGAFGETAVNSSPGSNGWSKVKRNSVIPYDPVFAAAATNAVTARLVIAKVNGATQTNTFSTAAGDYGWKIVDNGWDYGTFSLTLDFPGTAVTGLTTTLVRPVDGIILRMQ